MNLLASVLPGVRAVRTPLAAGAIGLVTLWLAIQPHVAADGTKTSVAKALHSGNDVLSPAARVAAVTFAAYLLGSLMTTATQMIAGLWLRNGWFYPLTTWLQEQLKARNIGPKPAVEDMSINDCSRYKALTASEDRGLPPLPSKAVRELVKARQLEWRLARFQLLRTDPASFSELDRLEAEAEFRFGVAIPIITLAVVLLCETGPYTRWAIVPTVVLLAVALVSAGVHATNQAEQLMVDCIRDGVVDLPLLAGIDRRPGAHMTIHASTDL